MDEREQTPRRMSLLRMLAAALSGAIGAFGVPAAAHASTPAPAAAAPPTASAPDTTPK